MKDQELNIVTYLQKVLNFYADKANYVENQFTGTDAFSRIELDRGEQARQAIKQVEDLLKQQEEMETDFEKLVEKANEEEELGEQNKRLLEELKKLKSG